MPVDEDLIARIELALRDVSAVWESELSEQYKADRQFIKNQYKFYKSQFNFAESFKRAKQDFLTKVLKETFNSPAYWQDQAETAFQELENIDKITKKAGYNGDRLATRVQDMAFVLLAVKDKDGL